MTPTTTPDLVSGSMPDLWRGTPTKRVCSKCGGGNIRLSCSYCGDSSFDHECNDGCRDCGGSDVSAIDWTDRAAVLLSVAWLADRGHACTRLLPTTHGGKVTDHAGLDAWTVAAILVARSVGRVARGLGPVLALAGSWEHDPNPGDAYESWGWTAWMRMRADGPGATRVYAPTRPRPLSWALAGWYYYRKGYGYQPPTSRGPETGLAGKLAADRAALADGMALCDPAGIILPPLEIA